MKEVVFTLPDLNGGVASVVRNLLENYHGNLKTKVILFRKKEYRHVSPIFKCDKQVIIEYDSKKPLNNVYRLFLKHINAESILVSNDGDIELGAIYYYHVNIPVIYILHGNGEYYYGIIKKYNAIIDKIIGVSSYLRNNIINLYPDIKTEFIPAPVPTQLHEKLEISKTSKFRIIYVGAVGYGKGVDFFPDFAKSLKSREVPFVFDIVGNGELIGDLKKEFDGCDQVIIHGQQPSSVVSNLMRGSDVLILFSRSEGLPLCVVEGMKHKLVPVVFDLPTGIHDVIEDGVNGFIVPQGDVEGAVECIERLYNNPDMMADMAEKAFCKANAMFDPIKQTETYFREFLNTEIGGRKYSISLIERILKYFSPKIYYPIYNHLHSRR